MRRNFIKINISGLRKKNVLRIPQVADEGGKNVSRIPQVADEGGREDDLNKMEHKEGIKLSQDMADIKN